VNAERVPESHLGDSPSKLAVVAVAAVRAQRGKRNIVEHPLRDHVERHLGLGAEHHILGDLRLGPARLVLCPLLGQVQFHVKRKVLAARGDGQRDRDLAVGDLAGGAGVLALDANAARPLLEEPRVVKDPGIHLLPLKQLRQRVVAGVGANQLVEPGRSVGEVQQLVVPLGVDEQIVASGHRGDRLDTLAFELAEQAHGVEREVRPALLAAKYPADAVEVRVEGCLRDRAGQRHAVSTLGTAWAQRGTSDSSDSRASPLMLAAHRWIYRQIASDPSCRERAAPNAHLPC
jgi:hypothetical protein